MITESLRKTLRRYANAETEISELQGMLSGNPPEFLSSFQDDIAEAIRSGDLTPDSVDEIMFRDFDDQAALDAWLRRAWAAWFPGEPYPS